MTKLLLRGTLSLGLLAVLASRLDWAPLMATLQGVRWGEFAGACLVLILASAVGGYRWALLARPLGFAAPVGQCVVWYMIGLFFNLLLPTSVGGDVIRAWYLGGGTRTTAAFVCVFVDRVSGLLLLVAIGCVATLLSPVPLPALVWFAAWGVALGGCVGIALLPWLVEWLPARWNWAGTVRQAVMVYRRQPGMLLSTSLISLGMQIGNVVCVWLLSLAIGVSIPLIYFGIAVPVVLLLTVAPVSLNGMGVREAGLCLVLVPAGVPMEQAVAIAVLWFATLVVAGLVGGVIYLSERRTPTAMPAPVTRAA
jgi:hypothetical protein